LFKSKEKHLKQGEKISKDFTKCLKRILQRICKNKTSGARVVQKILNKKKTIHAYLVEIIIGFIPSNLCTYLMQTSSILHF
jgi:hypothetical protein